MKRSALPAAIVLVVAAAAAGPAGASTITWEGITYSLTGEAITSTTPGAAEDQFTLTISGINASTDLEGGGRYGVDAFAFNQPAGFLSATAPGGFNTVVGGLNANGCNMHGNFYCFMANTPPPSSVLPGGSTLTYTFDVTASSASDFASYDPGFKIEWAGQNSYSLVSQNLMPTFVPLPADLSLLVSGLAALGLLGLAGDHASLRRRASNVALRCSGASPGAGSAARRAAVAPPSTPRPS